MEEKKQCPLCGKSINNADVFCEECQNHVDNQYTTNLLDADVTEIEPAEANRILGEEGKTAGDLAGEIAPPIIANRKEEPKKKGLSKGIIFLLAGCVLMVIIGVVSSLKLQSDRKSVENEMLYWDHCVEENTPLSYSKYLVAYPDGKYTEEATKRIRFSREEEIEAWEKLRKTSDINDYYAYLSENPETPYLKQIRSLMDSLGWRATIKDNTVGAYKAYLENVNLGNFSGDNVDVAKEKYTYLSEIVVLEGAALDSVKTSIKQIFKTMSEKDPKNLLKLFSPNTSYFGKKMTGTDLVALINDEAKKQKVKSVTYTPQEKTVKVKRDNRGVLFVDVSVNKETIYDIKIKNGKKTEDKKEKSLKNIFLELNSDLQVRLIK